MSAGAVNLDKDVLCYSAEWLDVADLCTLSKCGRSWRALARSPLIWQRLILNKFGIVLPLQTSIQRLIEMEIGWRRQMASIATEETPKVLSNLFWAFDRGYSRLVRSWALQHRDELFRTSVLGWAAHTNRLELAKQLISMGFDVNHRLKHDQLTEACAVVRFKQETFDVPPGHPWYERWRDQAALVALLIESKANLNPRPPPQGSLPLQLAILYGNVPLVKQLLAARADPKLLLPSSCRENTLVNPHLLAAINAQRWHTLELLLNLGATFGDLDVYVN